jgi:cell division protease FtsH
MDGFDQSRGIVVPAATNRPETLDPALLRPGRFDRHVTVPLPNQAERAAILTVHSRGKTLAPDVDWDTVARATPGFSGADLANLVNEAAINAVRAGGVVIDGQDLGDARDRLLLGRRESTNALLPEERHAVAVHESGHALMAALCEHADPVAKVTILPSGPSLGATEQLPEAERHLYVRTVAVSACWTGPMWRSPVRHRPPRCPACAWATSCPAASRRSYTWSRPYATQPTS